MWGQLCRNKNKNMKGGLGFWTIGWGLVHALPGLRGPSPWANSCLFFKQAFELVAAMKRNAQR